MRDWRKTSRDRRRKAGLDNVDSVNGRNKRTCKKLDNLVLGSQMGPTGCEEDTYVAVLERAPQKNEEVMVVFAKGVQCQ
jgi:hypothetical protein